MTGPEALRLAAARLRGQALRVRHGSERARLARTAAELDGLAQAVEANDGSMVETTGAERRRIA
jgi:hypothetical protein